MALLSLDAVSKSYARGATNKRVLSEVSLDVGRGDLVAVYGKRNAGKTTLLEIAAGFDDPDEGRVTFEGTDLASLPRRELARLHRDRIAWADGAGSLSCELAPLDYVALPLYRRLGPRVSRRRALDALVRVGAEESAYESWDDLSATTQALVAIAQALAREPSLLVADDPTAGLGILERERIVGLLREAAQEGGLGVLMAAPEMAAMVPAHEVRALSRGRLREPRAEDGDGPATVIPLHRGKRTG